MSARLKSGISGQIPGIVESFSPGSAVKKVGGIPHRSPVLPGIGMGQIDPGAAPETSECKKTQQFPSPQQMEKIFERRAF